MEKDLTPGLIVHTRSPGVNWPCWDVSESSPGHISQVGQQEGIRLEDCPTKNVRGTLCWEHQPWLHQSRGEGRKPLHSFSRSPTDPTPTGGQRVQFETIGDYRSLPCCWPTITEHHRTNLSSPKQLVMYWAPIASDPLTGLNPPCHTAPLFNLQNPINQKKISHPQGAQGAQLAAPSNSPPRMGPTKSPTEKHSAKKLKPFACDEKKAGGVSGVRHLKGGKSKTSDVTLPMSMRAWYNNW